MSPTVILERKTSGILELRRSRFEIVLDGDPAGSIDRNQTVELPVEAGKHTLQVRAGRFRAERRSSTLQTEQTSASAATERSFGPNTSRHFSCPRSASGSSASNFTDGLTPGK
jgi:hypothetical protein